MLKIKETAWIGFKAEVPERGGKRIKLGIR
jgi:hypothetical protein